MSFIDCINCLIPNSIKQEEGEGIVPRFEIKYETVTIRPLIQNDINEIVIARKCQEEENNNGVTDEYLEQYSTTIKGLFEKGLIIGVGAFISHKLISLSFFNLLSYGNEKKLPYLCAVWTNSQYRGKGLATKVNNKLLEGVAEEIDKMQESLLLTVEGGEPAYKLYSKEGYKRKEGEMQFLGDLNAPYFSNTTKIIKSNKEHTEKISFTEDKVEQMSVEYSNEQLFPHPSNVSGKMCRIIDINILNPNLTLTSLKSYLQYFFSQNRFCKFNANELLQYDSKLLEVFRISQKESSRLGNEFEKLSFTDINGKQINIKKSNNVMENTIQNALEHSLNRKGSQENLL